MSIVSKQPTANTTPDQGGTTAVSTPTNTGHGSTTATGNNSSQSKSCRWSGLANVSGQRISTTLKFDWSRNGRIDDVIHNSNEFIAQYTLNGGGAWTTVFDNLNYTDNTSGSSSVSLPLNQDISQVQVRDLGSGFSDQLGFIGQSIFSISNIQVEVVLRDATVVIALM